MKKTFFAVLLTMAGISATFAQYQNVRISPMGSYNEPSIYINPKNPMQIMAGSNLNYVFYSEDAGYTWTTETLVSLENGVWGDPVIMTDTLGDFYYFHLSNPPSGNWIDRIVCQKYDKQTASWNDGSYMGLNGEKAQDKHWVVVDQATNTIYSTWTQFDTYGVSDPDCHSVILFSKSTDAGQSWSPAKQISIIPGDCIDSGNTNEGAVPAVGINGEVFVCWSGPNGLVFNRSLDGGETWLENEIFVGEQPGGWDFAIPGIYRSNGLPVTAVDLSNGPNRGTIYVNFADQRNGTDDTDIWLVKSTDSGNTWSDPIRVNDDPAGKQQFFTWMAVDQVTGYLYLVFYDRRNYSNNQTDVYMAVSRDGGSTFENILISESPFTPTPGQFFGDYNNISAHNNMVRPIWVRMVNGVTSIWTAIIDMGVTVPEHDLKPFSLEQNYPNPFKVSTIFSYKITKASQVNLSVYDQFGREVVKLIDSQLIPIGKYEITFDAVEHHLSPGVYYFGLKSDKSTVRRKMVVSD
ncbi:MAG: T9SS type A sorting domain-containing protein [Bacteroidetes bacterium]|nr:T9SS type A sorting domain-containing protein [Bacteroidota bacterium]